MLMLSYSKTLNAKKNGTGCSIASARSGWPILVHPELEVSMIIMPDAIGSFAYSCTIATRFTCAKLDE